MKRLSCSCANLSKLSVSTFVLSVFGAVFCLVADENSENQSVSIEMYHCADKTHNSYKMGRSSLAPSEKLVYGYVNGRRTECMTEEDFNSRFCKSVCIPKPPTVAMSYAMSSMPSSKNYAGSNFRDSDLFGMDMQFADCRRTDFSRADMRSIKMQGADCQGANFEGALVKNANLRNADLSEANLKNTYFVCADLRGVKGLTLDNIRLAATVYNCKMDPELVSLITQYCPSKYHDVSRNWGMPEEDGNMRARRVSR
jgi:hypothetical protein